MATQIPTISLGNVPQPASVGRIDANPINVAGIEQPLANAAEGANDAVTKYARTQEALAAHTAAVSASNEYDSWYNAQLEGRAPNPNTGDQGVVGLKNQQGDPAPISAKLSRDAQQKMEDIKGKYSAAQDATKQAINASLGLTNKRYSDRQNDIYGTLQNKFINKTADDQDRINVNDFVNQATTADFNSLDTAGKLDKALEKIKNDRLTNAVKINGAQFDENSPIDPITGLPTKFKPQVAPEIAISVAKSTSDAVFRAINVQLANKQLPQAQALYDKYKDSLDSVHQPQVEKNLENALIEQKGDALFQQAKNLPKMGKDQLAFVEHAIVDKDEYKNNKIKELAENRLSSYQNKMNIQNNLYDKDVVGGLTQDIFNSRYKTVDELHQSLPFRQALLDGHLDPDKISTLDRLVRQNNAPPEKSDPDTLAEANKLISDGSNSLRGMSPAELAQKQIGLSKEDSNKLHASWAAYNAQTPSKDAELKSSLYKAAERAMVETGKTDRSIGIRPDNDTGKYSNKDKDKLNQMHDWIDQQLHAPHPATMDADGMNKMVKDHITELVKNKVTDPGFFSNMINKAENFFKPSKTQQTPEQQKQPITPPSAAIDQEARNLAIANFYKTYGRPPDMTTDELDKFIKKGK